MQTAKERAELTPQSRPEAGLFFRSDHFSFAKRGVPAISYSSGNDLVDGGVAAGVGGAMPMGVTATIRRPTN